MKEKHWIDNADSWICPVCRFECDNPAKYDGCKCPKCGFQDEKDRKQSEGVKFVSFNCRKCGIVLHVGTIEDICSLIDYPCPECGEEPDEGNWLLLGCKKGE